MDSLNVNGSEAAENHGLFTRDLSDAVLVEMAPQRRLPSARVEQNPDRQYAQKHEGREENHLNTLGGRIEHPQDEPQIQHCPLPAIGDRIHAAMLS